MRYELLNGAALLEILAGSQLVKKFPEFYGTYRSLTRAHKPVTRPCSEDDT
jgi:hypothetical protein